MKNILFLIPSLFTLSMCSKNTILPKAPYCISEFGKKYSFYSSDSDLLYAQVSVNRNMDSITINIEYKIQEELYVILDERLPEFSISREKEDCMPKNPPTLESVIVNEVDYFKKLDESIDALPETTVIFKYKETIPENYMISFPITSSFLHVDTWYLNDLRKVYFFQGKEDGETYDGIKNCQCNCEL